jgi:hypothetical protein
MRTYLEKILKKAGGVAEGVGPEFKPHYHTHTQNGKVEMKKRQDQPLLCCSSFPSIT